MTCRPEWEHAARREAVRMARDGLIEIRDAAGNTIDPWDIEESPEGVTWVLTDKGRDLLARARRQNGQDQV